MRNIKIILLAVLISVGLSTMAQVAVNNDGTPPDESAILDIKSTDKGMLLPCMTANQRNSISLPATGLLVFVTDDNNFYFYNGAAWIQFSGSGNPVGTIEAFGGTTVPDGWLLCDGSEVSRIIYPNLYNAISTNWGAGDESTTFNLPDLRGRFLRGTDHGAGTDPDAAARTAQNTLGNSGDNVGSVQNEAYKSHNHSVNPPNTSTEPAGDHRHTFNSSQTSEGYTGSGKICAGGGSGGQSIANTPMNEDGDHRHYINIGAFNSASSGNNETRPKNVYVDYIIKF